MVIRILFVLSVLCSSLSAQIISIEAKTDSANYLVGDFINLTFKVRAEKNISYINPLFKDSLKNIEIISSSEPDTQNTETGRTIIYSFVVSGYDSADVTIPPVPFEFRTKNDSTLRINFSNPVSFTIRTVAVDPEKDIKDVKEPIRIPINWWTIVLYFLIGAVILLLIFLLYKRFKRREKKILPERKIFIPPHKIALDKLEALKKEELWQKGYVKEFHSRITGIIREYFENRFNIPALERTTTETVELLRNHKEKNEITSITQAFLTNADMVKFAKFSPLPSLNEEMIEQAQQIVKTTAVTAGIEEGAEENV